MPPPQAEPAGNAHRQGPEAPARRRVLVDPEALYSRTSYPRSASTTRPCGANLPVTTSHVTRWRARRRAPNFARAPQRAKRRRASSCGWCASCPADQAYATEASFTICTTSVCSWRLIPAFAPVVGRVHHDIYHVYPVDVHSVAAVASAARSLPRRLSRRITRSHMPSARSLARTPCTSSRPCSTISAKDLGGQPAPRARDARRSRVVVLERLGVADSDIVEVQHHVIKHLRMDHVATPPRTSTIPSTLEEFSDDG